MQVRHICIESFTSLREDPSDPLYFTFTFPEYMSIDDYEVHVLKKEDSAHSTIHIENTDLTTSPNTITQYSIFIIEDQGAIIHLKEPLNNYKAINYRLGHITMDSKIPLTLLLCKHHLDLGEPESETLYLSPVLVDDVLTIKAQWYPSIDEFFNFKNEEFEDEEKYAIPVDRLITFHTPRTLRTEKDHLLDNEQITYNSLTDSMEIESFPTEVHENGCWTQVKLWVQDSYNLIVHRIRGTELCKQYCGSYQEI